ncbi:MAG: polynucleotide adenylyltransferase PcnB [Gammaproteobacteria bacterium]
MDNRTNKISRIHPQPSRIPRSEHNISRSQISENALKVLYRLRKGGYDAFLVGGSVRDILLGREPKDFDVATNAWPEQIRELFRNSRLIGRRFRLAHVRYGDEIIEVSTFRAGHRDDLEGEGHMIEGRIIRDNVYGSIEDDAWRRDFTVNGLYYNIEDFSVIDYVGGLADIKAGRIRLIGKPDQRYIEDPVRMLRAVRFAVRLGFRIDPDSERPIYELNELLTEIPPARLFEEIIKLFTGGMAEQTFEQLRHYDLFRVLFPQTDAALLQQEGGFPHTLLIHAFRNTDVRIGEGKPVAPGFLVAALLWTPMMNLAQEYIRTGLSEIEACNLAGDVVISKQVSRTAMPRRFTQMARDIWQMQFRLKRTRGNRPHRLLQHPKFRAAYDFLLLRTQAGEGDESLADWWTAFLEAPENAGLQAETHPPRNKKRRGKRRGRKVET